MKQEKNKGFTLTEIVVSIAVGTVLFSVATVAIINLNRLTTQAQALAVANAAAENKAEEIRSIGYLELDSDGDGTFSIDSSELPPILINPIATYQVITPEPGIKEVEIELTYSYADSTNTIAYTTYVSELGVGQ